MHIIVLAAGQEEDYRWLPDNPSNDIDEALGCLTPVDKVNSLVAWRLDDVSCSVLAAKIPTATRDSHGRALSVTVLTEGLAEPEARALVMCYLLSRERFYEGVRNAVDTTKEGASVDWERLQAHLSRSISLYHDAVNDATRGPLHPGAYRNSMALEPQYDLDISGEFLRNYSLSPGRGIKIVLSDFGRDRACCADILLAAKEIPEQPELNHGNYGRENSAFQRTSLHSKGRILLERTINKGKNLLPKLKQLGGAISDKLQEVRNAQRPNRENSLHASALDMNHYTDKTAFRLAVREFLVRANERLGACAAQPPVRLEINPDDIPGVKMQIQHAVGALEKMGNVGELCAQGKRLLIELGRQPALGDDETAMHAYLRACASAFSEIEDARRGFEEAVEDCIAKQIPAAAPFRKRAESDEEKLLREFQPGGIAVSLADVLTSAQKKPLRNIPENETQKKVTLNWRSLDSAVYALPEYSRYREAVVEAVQTLSVAMEELEFCLPADICVSEIREMDNFLRKTWKDFWQEQAPDGILVDSLKGMLQTIDMAFDRILGDAWTKELRRLEMELQANPVKQYNNYYNPK